MLLEYDKSEQVLSVPQLAQSPLFSNSLEAQVGNTPLLSLYKTAVANSVPAATAVYAKAEWFNPGGSVKDRAALNIIRMAEMTGQLQPGMTILDATSGNTGIAFAMLGAARGYKVKLALPENASQERVAILRAYGAEIIFTDPMEATDGAILVARRLAAEDPDLFYADQYNNPANWQAHYLTTANEIWEQTNGRITHFIAGMGTSGTFTGTTRRLRELNPNITCIAMQPDSPFNGLEGLKHLPTAIKPGIYDENLADINMMANTEEAYAMARFLAQQEGLFVGVSSAAAVSTAIRVAKELTEGVVVTVLPDNGIKYMSDQFWME